MRRLPRILAIVLVSIGMLAPSARADVQPGDPCPTDGAVVALAGGYVKCTSGTWQPTTQAPAGPSAGPNDSPPPTTSTVRAARYFRTIGTALSQDTFSSTARQVADPAAVRLQDGRVRIFAFVNSATAQPGLRSATSTNAAGTTFVADTFEPLEGVAAGQPRLVPLGGSRLRLFYVEGGNINSAISSDAGESFTVEGPVITTAQAGFEPGGITIVRHRGLYRAYFSNLERPGVLAPRVMRTATSADMRTWTMGPVITQGSGPLAEGGSHPFAVARKGTITLYYAGDRGSYYGVLMSASKDGVSFRNERAVMAGGGDPDLVSAGKDRYLMYFGADLGAAGFGVTVARSTRIPVPRSTG